MRRYSSARPPAHSSCRTARGSGSSSWTTMSRETRQRSKGAPAPRTSRASARRSSSTAASTGLPDVRDGLTREERVVLYVLHETQKERGDRNVPTAMLWGRVCEHFYISPEDLSAMLARLGARR